MTYIIVLTIAALTNLFSYAADATDAIAADAITQLLLASRTDQDDIKQQQKYLASVKSIKSSNLDNKNITDATLQTFLAQASDLKTLSAQHNFLRNPQPPIQQHCGLTTLDFTHGTIETFSIGDWVTLCPALVTIKLAHNKIRDIASNNDVIEKIACTICGPKYKKAWHSDYLQELDLSHNELTVFDLHMLDNAPNLTKADFSHNTIADVVIPKSFRDREQPCTVLLYHNQLNDAHKQALHQNNSLYTKDYRNTTFNATAYSGLTGLCIGTGGGIPIGPAIANTVGIGTSVVMFGLIVGGGLLLAVPAYTIAHYCYPKNKRTYQPFAFEFEATLCKDYLVVELEEA